MRYRGRAIGSSVDTDGSMVSLAASYTDPADRRVHASWRSIVVNRTAAQYHAVVPGRESYRLFTDGADLPLDDGAVSFDARFSDGVEHKLDARLSACKRRMALAPAGNASCPLEWRTAPAPRDAADASAGMTCRCSRSGERRRSGKSYARSASRNSIAPEFCELRDPTA